MSKAEEKALEAYPVVIEHLHYLDWIKANGGKAELDINAMPRIYFNQGYEKAEEDLTLTWEDIQMIDHFIIQLVGEERDGKKDWGDGKQFYQEVLRRFNEQRNK